MRPLPTRPRGGMTALVAVLSLAACGGSSSSPAVPVGTWVSNVCGALQSWYGVVTKQPTELSNPDLSRGLAPLKQALSGYLGNVVTASDAMVTRIRQAGDPAVDNGPALENDVVSDLQPVANGFRDAKVKADALPVADPVAFQKQAQEISASLTRIGDQAKSSFDALKTKYPNSGIDAAFNSNPRCKELKAAP